MRRSRFSNFATLFVSFLNTIRIYLTAILLIYFVADRVSSCPGSGAYGVNVKPGFNLPFILSVLQHLILPVATYVIAAFGGQALTMKVRPYLFSAPSTSVPLKPGDLTGPG